MTAGVGVGVLVGFGVDVGFGVLVGRGVAVGSGVGVCVDTGVEVVAGTSVESGMFSCFCPQAVSVIISTVKSNKVIFFIVIPLIYVFQTIELLQYNHSIKYDMVALKKQGETAQVLLSFRRRKWI